MAIETQVKVRTYPDRNALTTHAKGYVRIASMAGNDMFKLKIINLDIFATEADRGKADLDEADKTKWTSKKPIYRVTIKVPKYDYDNASNDFGTVDGVYAYLKTKKLFEDSPVEINLTAGKEV